MANYSSVDFESILLFLDQQVELFEKPEFTIGDPLGIVKRFSNPLDQEIVGLLSSTIAWGNRVAIVKSSEKIVEIMHQEPYKFLMNTDENDWETLEFVHRTFNAEDLKFFFKSLKTIYSKYNSLEDVFMLHPEIEGIKGRIVNFRNQFCSTPHMQRSEKHISNPEKGSSCKRLNMFLRWMVRSNIKGVDLGIWKTIPTSELRVPLDVHTARIARNLGLLHRVQNDWKALDEMHEILNRFDPNDPAKYDFALFGLGISGYHK